MAGKSLRDISRSNYFPNESPSYEGLQTGCLQRIADATEIMASNYVQLQKDRDWYKQKYEEQQRKIASLENTIKSLRGWITKWKSKAKNQDGN